MPTITTNAPKSGSRSSSPPTTSMTANIGRKPCRKLCMQRRLAHRVVGRVEHGEQLHELRWLQSDRAEREPAARAVDFATDAGNEHQEEQHDAAMNSDGAARCQSRIGTWKANIAETIARRGTPRDARGNTPA